ncbi:hypothetical protein VDIAB_271120 [Vibrio diabolicus]|nr:hypothetical protein VDIAB_271120 [Vibrio diabolicus]
MSNVPITASFAQVLITRAQTIKNGYLSRIASAKVNQGTYALIDHLLPLYLSLTEEGAPLITMFLEQWKNVDEGKMYRLNGSKP